MLDEPRFGVMRARARRERALTCLHDSPSGILCRQGIETSSLCFMSDLIPEVARRFGLASGWPRIVLGLALRRLGVALPCSASPPSHLAPPWLPRPCRAW